MRLHEGMLLTYPWLRGAKELNPSAFVWEERTADNTMLVQDRDAAGALPLPEGWVVIGWGDGGKIAVRPNPETVVVLFEEDCNRFWFHFV